MREISGVRKLAAAIGTFYAFSFLRNFGVTSNISEISRAEYGVVLQRNLAIPIGRVTHNVIPPTCQRSAHAKAAIIRRVSEADFP